MISRAQRQKNKKIVQKRQPEDEPSRISGSAGVTLKAQRLTGQEGKKNLFVVIDVVQTVTR